MPKKFTILQFKLEPLKSNLGPDVSSIGLEVLDFLGARGAGRTRRPPSPPEFVPVGPLVDSRGRICVTLARASKMTGVQKRTLRNAIHRRRLPAERAKEPCSTGSYAWLIPVDHVIAWRRELEQRGSRKSQHTCVRGDR